MRYQFEILIQKDLKEEWVVWTKGSLSDCIDEFFHWKGDSSDSYLAFRLTAIKE